jgi:hypothetical protein
MKYVNKSFTMPVCGRTMTDLQYDLAVGKITQAQFDAASRPVAPPAHPKATRRLRPLKTA